MGLIEQELKELRQLNKDLMSGKISEEHVNARVSIYSQTEKRMKIMLQAYGLAAKHRGLLGRVVRSNLIGDGEAIDIDTDVETEKVKCPEKDGELITRAECCEFAGSNPDRCTGCDNREATYRLLLGGNTGK